MKWNNISISISEMNWNCKLIAEAQILKTENFLLFSTNEYENWLWERFSPQPKWTNKETDEINKKQKKKQSGRVWY